MRQALTVAFVGVGGWVLALLLHEQAVRRAMCGRVQGIDWDWADPRQTGQSWLFSTPWVRDLRSGEVIQVPFMMRGGA